MNALVQNLKDSKINEKGAFSFSTTSNPLLDLFALGGSYRSRSDEEVISLVRDALDYDLINTIKCLFYFRDVREGQGERRFFRVGMTYVFDNIDPSIFALLYLSLVPEYGRWDDLIYIYDHVENKTIKEMIILLIKKQIEDDEKTEEVSLLGKWLPSENTSSKETVRLARKIRKALNYNSIDYRKLLTSLRKKIKIVESQMCNKEWGKINYPNVPSKAMLKYNKAFDRNDHDRYQAYLDDVKAGKSKINTKTLYPAEIIHKFFRVEKEDIKSLETIWNSLPNFINEANKNALVVADTSGSMTWHTSGGVFPIDVAVSLALYFAERCEGEFANSFITFEENPHFIYLDPKLSFEDKVITTEGAGWGGSTNIDKVFEMILTRAQKAKIAESEMPKLIYIISDMEFDGCVRMTNLEHWKEMYEDAGYEIPKIVFWNVSARNDTLPAQNEEGVTLVSGYSSNTFRFAVGEGTPEDFMNEVLGSERYSIFNDGNEYHIPNRLWRIFGKLTS